MACTLLLGALHAEVYEVSKSSPMIKLPPKPLVRDSAKEVVIDPKTKLMWQDDASVTTVIKTWQGAIDYCEALRFAGYDDWRLPKRLELLSIADKSKTNPAIKAGFVNVVSGDFWSSSSYVSYADYAWYVYFDGGLAFTFFKSTELCVRCVRESKL